MCITCFVSPTSSCRWVINHHFLSAVKKQNHTIKNDSFSFEDLFSNNTKSSLTMFSSTNETPWLHDMMLPGNLYTCQQHIQYLKLRKSTYHILHILHSYLKISNRSVRQDVLMWPTTDCDIRFSANNCVQSSAKKTLIFLNNILTSCHGLDYTSLLHIIVKIQVFNPQWD